MAISNLFISIPLARAYGGVGAATGTAVSLLICNVLIMNWYYHKKIGLDIIYFWKEIFGLIKALLLPTIVGISIYLFVDLYRITIFLIYAFIYVIIFVFLCGIMV